MYEYSLEEIIVSTLEKAYLLKGEKLKEYLITRYMLLNKIKKIEKIKTTDFANFICDILYINVINGKFEYYGTLISVNSYIEDSILSIVENWDIFAYIHRIFSKSDMKSTISQIEKYCENLILSGIRKSSKIETFYKKYYYDDYVLTQLNHTYNISPNFPELPKELGPLKDKAIATRTYEDVCKAYIQSMLLESTKNTLVSEKDIETFLYQNHKKYFLNTELIGRQVKIGSGYIADIVLSDEKNDYIIEIKNKKDDRLYWQAVNYYNIYKQKTNKDVKVITIAPEYSSEMIMALRTLPYVLIKEFSLKIENGKIVELKTEDL